MNKLETNRPLRARTTITLRVGQDSGDLRGSDDTVIQAGIEYLHRMGGGTLQVLPGEYMFRNSVFLRPGVTLRGSGEETVFLKAPGVVSKLIRDADWFEYGVQVENTAGFSVGGGVMLRSLVDGSDWAYDILRATITGIDDHFLMLDRTTQKNFYVKKGATAGTIFPLLTADQVDDVSIENLVLDGARDHNEHINGNYAGAVFIENCNSWTFRNVVAREFNGDGFSFQVCDDIRFHNCKSIHNADLGFHPGSGSQRPLFSGCTASGNDQGIFFCWGVSDGRVENCLLSENNKYGISIGHRDTDNSISKSTIEKNREVGIYFRNAGNEFSNAHRNRIEQCVLRDNGDDNRGTDIEINGETHDITISECRFERTSESSGSCGIRMGSESGRIQLKDNTFTNYPVSGRWCEEV